MNIAVELEKLKGRACQWLFSNAEARIRFNGEIKEISEDHFFQNIAVKFKGNKSMYVSLSKPLAIQRDEDDKTVKYRVFSNKKQVLTVGYLKDA